jgi:hypothetical protein
MPKIYLAQNSVSEREKYAGTTEKPTQSGAAMNFKQRSFYRTSNFGSPLRRLIIRASIACSTLLATVANAADCTRTGACTSADVLEPGTGWLILLAVLVLYVARSPRAARWANKPLRMGRLFRRLRYHAKVAKEQAEHSELVTH